ncbi:MAG TPA: cupin domain-containing protein [Gemmataceae bacterium]|jgi:quercetin dioxygenase-like cupin family protein
MQIFNLSDLVAVSEREGQRWREFLRVPSLSMGLYRLKAGQADEQQPHTEDEVYIVVSGRAVFRAGGQEQVVGSGSVIFVERAVEHRFVEITEDLTVLVFFAPPEGSRKGGAESVSAER